jgi:hypothetical protein
MSRGLGNESVHSGDFKPMKRGQVAPLILVRLPFPIHKQRVPFLAGGVLKGK